VSESTGKPSEAGRAMSKGPGRARAVSAAKLARQRAAERRRKAMFGAGIAAVVLIASVIIGVAVYQTRDRAPDQFAIPKNATATAVVVGRPDAKVTVDLYVDYLCPGCRAFEKQAAAELDKLVADGTAKIAYHPIAILDHASTTKYSTRASAASGCAAAEGTAVYDKFTKALFANQPPEGSAGLPNEKLIELGKAAGATSPEFAKCVDDQRYAGWTTALTETASKDGVTRTPTVKVDGVEVEDLSVDSVRKAVTEAASK